MRVIASFAALLLMLLVTSAGVAATPSDQQTPTEEFVGPFPSWRQVQCTGGDDTALLQNELNTLGQSGSPVLYIKAGTCRITSTLQLGQKAGGGAQNITLLGHDPADTTILWAGPSGGTMMEVDGVAHSRFGRLTWDGGGTAGYAYLDATANGQNYFPTGDRHEDEVFRNLASNGVAYYLGGNGTGTSEWEYIRERFVGPMSMAIYLANANTLDHWVWDSQFENLANGIGNFNNVRNENGGGGDFAVSRSNFLNNGNDIVFGNVQPFGSSRWNYSRGSKIHMDYFGVGRVNAAVTVQGVTILDPQSPGPVGNLNAGPLALLDSTIRGGKSEGQIGAYEAYCGDKCMGDFWAVGNTFSNTSSGQYYVPGPCCGRFHNFDDTYGATVNDPGPINLPPTPPQSTAPVIEVQGGDIAAALAQAGNNRAIVHVPYGRYNVTQTLEVGPNVTLTGDGYGATELDAIGTTVSPILHLAGPSHAVVRDLKMRGWNQNGRVTEGLLIDNADQPGGLVHSEFAMLQEDKAAWDISGLSQTTVDLFDDYNGANTHCGMDGSGPDTDYKVTNARLHIFNGAGAGTDAMFTLNGGEVLDETHYFEGNPGCQPAQLLAPNGSGSLTIDQGNFSPAVGGFDTRSFNGSFTLLDFANTLAGDQPASNLTCRCLGPNSLVMGLAYGGLNEKVAPTFQAPYVYWEGQSVNHNNPEAESSADVSDQNQFVREHLALLRNTKPLSLEPRVANVTDVRLYRVGGDRLTSALSVRGAGGTLPTPGPTNTPGPTSTPGPTNTTGPTSTPAPTNTVGPTATPAPTSLPGQGVWITPPVASVTADATWDQSPLANILFTCQGGGWNAGEYTVNMIATFTKPTTFSGVRILASASPDADESYTFKGLSTSGSWVTLGVIQAHVVGAWNTYDVNFPQGTYSQLQILGNNNASWLALSHIWVLAPVGTTDPCGAPVATATTQPTATAVPATAVPTATQKPPTATPVPTAQPTATAVPPTPKPTATPTAVPTETTSECRAVAIQDGELTTFSRPTSFCADQ